MLPDEYIPLPNQAIQKQAHSMPKHIEVISVELAQTAQLPSRRKTILLYHCIKFFREREREP